MYDTRAEFEQKLLGCVVLYKDSPTLIKEIAGADKRDFVLYHKDLRSGVKAGNNPFDTGWDFRTIGSRLGYTNYDLGAGGYRQSLYLTRMAVRHSSGTQGLSQRNVAYEPLRSQPRVGLVSEYKIPWNDLIARPNFHDTLERKYPKYPDLVQEFSKDDTLISKAWNPCFAIYRPEVGPFYLLYKDKKIGYTDDPGYRWRLGQDYDYLKESLDHLKVRTY